jgi:hypothetical protein
MQQLMFANPVFHQGLNVTVRLGNKWLKFFEDQQNNQFNYRPVSIELATPDGEKVGEGQIEAVRLTSFVDISDEVLDLEHDNRCRDWSGLYNEMKVVYGDQFIADSEVTVVFFTVKT